MTLLLHWCQGWDKKRICCSSATHCWPCKASKCGYYDGAGLDCATNKCADNSPQAAACGADGEEVETGEAGRNWQRPPPPPLNPKLQPLGEQRSIRHGLQPCSSSSPAAWLSCEPALAAQQVAQHQCLSGVASRLAVSRPLPAQDLHASCAQRRLMKLKSTRGVRVLLSHVPAPEFIPKSLSRCMLRSVPAAGDRLHDRHAAPCGGAGP